MKDKSFKPDVLCLSSTGTDEMLSADNNGTKLKKGMVIYMINATRIEMVQPLTMVLVTDQFRCQRLIVAGREIATRNGTPLEIINIAKPDTPQNPEAVEFLFQISKENDATMMVHYSDEPAKFLSSLIKDKMPAYVVSGMPQSADSLLHKLWTRFGLISFYTVDEGGVAEQITLSSRVIA